MSMLDAVVIGGGVHGCAVGYELAGRGLDVVVVERRELASGASGGVGKRGVRANNRDPRELPLARAALEVWPHLAEMLGADTGYERTGGLQVVQLRDDIDGWLLDHAEAVALVQNSLGVTTEVVDRARIDDLEPDLAPDVDAATWCPADGMADQTLVTKAYAAAAERRGARVVVGEEVTGVTASETFRVDLATDEPLVAKRVIVAANTHAPRLVAEAFGVRLPVWTASLQVILAKARDGYRPARLVGHLSRTLSVKALEGGVTMISGGYHGRWDPDTETGTPLESRVRDNLDGAAAVFPRLADIDVLSADTERVDSFCHDRVPVIDEVPEFPGAFVATGWTGHGFAIAPAVAASLAEWIVTGSRPEVLAPFGLERFGLG